MLCRLILLEKSLVIFGRVSRYAARGVFAGPMCPHLQTPMAPREIRGVFVPSKFPVASQSFGSFWVYHATHSIENYATFGIDAPRYILYRAAVMKTFQHVIDAWPSTRAFGDDVGTTDSHVRTMRARNSIPSGFWEALVKKAAEQGRPEITLELLAAIAKAKRDAA